MSSTAVVTSCSKEGWEKYGARFVQTFDQHWPLEVNLHIVSEDFDTFKVQDLARKAYIWCLDDSRLAAAFYKRHKFTKWVAGNASQPRPEGVAKDWHGSHGYSFRHDAYKFSKKVFAIELIAEQLNGGRLIWLDADVVTHSVVPMSAIDKLMPDDKAVSHLARPGYHSECGFVGYNLNHPECMKFISTFAALYGSDTVFELQEWHDSWVFDWTLRKLNTPTYEIPHRSVAHPFINSELGQYMDHLKGGRKDKGRSHSYELLNAKYHKLPYWQGAT